MKTQTTDLKEVYVTFMRLKTNKPQMECTVPAGRKDKVNKNGSKAGRKG